MSKKEYQQAQRIKPIGEAGIAKCRTIVAECQAAKINEVLMDSYSASAVIAVFDALNEKNRMSFVGMPVARAVEVAFKLVA